MTDQRVFEVFAFLELVDAQATRLKDLVNVDVFGHMFMKAIF